MCGPLVLAFGLKQRSLGLRALQQLGRIVGYGILGFVIGLLGGGVQLFNIGQKVSLVSGVIILISTVYYLYFKDYKLGFELSFLSKWRNYFLANAKNSGLRFFGLGLINSLLPCGLLFVALLASASMGSLQSSVVYMLFFGLGTAPALLVVLLAGSKILQKFGHLQSKIVPAMSIAMAVLLIVRGLGIGIPYLSPKIDVGKQVPSCCKYHKSEGIQKHQTF
jgi:sulfite exporter TauE/SafE